MWVWCLQRLGHMSHRHVENMNFSAGANRQEPAIGRKRERRDRLEVDIERLLEIAVEQDQGQARRGTRADRHHAAEGIHGETGECCRQIMLAPDDPIAIISPDLDEARRRIGYNRASFGAVRQADRLNERRPIDDSDLPVDPLGQVITFSEDIVDVRPQRQEVLHAYRGRVQ